MATTSGRRGRGAPLAAVLAAAGLPPLLRSLVHGLVAGPITSAHVLLAQAAFLALAAVGARRVASATGHPPPPWRAWIVDATSFVLALALITAGRVASGHRGPTWPTLEAVTLVVTAPIVEEIVYRGLLPGILALNGRSARRDAWRILDALVASTAFALGHAIGNGSVGDTALRTFVQSFSCGLAFHLLRLASGGLAAPMAAHASVNAMSLHAMG